MNPIKLYFYNWAFWVRLIFVGIMIGIGVWFDHLWPVETDYHWYLGGFGCFCFLFGDFLTGSGFTVKLRNINTSTPTVVWRIAALLFWGTALAVLIGSQP